MVKDNFVYSYYATRKEVKIMRKLWLTAIAFSMAVMSFTSIGVKAEEGTPITGENFPSSELFRIAKNKDVNQDKILSPSEAAVVDQLDLTAVNIGDKLDLKGIKAFTNCNTVFLTNYKMEKITSDMLPKELESLTLTGMTCEEVNIADMKSLTYTMVNASNIQKLSVQNDKVLNHLEVQGGTYDDISIQDLSKLKTLSVDGVATKTFSLGKCNGLQRLFLKNFLLNKFDFSAYKKLKYVEATKLGLKKVTLNNPALKDLNISSNKLKTINLSKCKKLQTLNVKNNQLKTIDLLKCKAMKKLAAQKNKLKKVIVYKKSKVKTDVAKKVKKK